MTDERILFEQVWHCLGPPYPGGPGQTGPGANCPLLPPHRPFPFVGGTAVEYWFPDLELHVSTNKHGIQYTHTHGRMDYKILWW